MIAVACMSNWKSTTLRMSCRRTARSLRASMGIAAADAKGNLAHESSTPCSVVKWWVRGSTNSWTAESTAAAANWSDVVAAVPSTTSRRISGR